MDNPESLLENIVRTPNPDPTVLTTAALLREIASLKELFSTRLDAMDKVMALFNEGLVRQSAELSKQVATCRELHDRRFIALDTELATRRDLITTMINSVSTTVTEKFGTMEERFKSIQTQFAERDIRTEQTSRDDKIAVDAALQAAKEAFIEQNRSSALAISKSESSTVKQIDQQAILITTGTRALDDKIDDLKERVARLESHETGKKTGEDRDRANITLIISFVSLVFVAVGLAIAFLVKNP